MHRLHSPASICKLPRQAGEHGVRHKFVKSVAVSICLLVCACTQEGGINNEVSPSDTADVIAQETLATVTGPAFDWQIREPSEAAQTQFDEAETAYDAEDYETAAPLYDCLLYTSPSPRDRG